MITNHSDDLLKARTREVQAYRRLLGKTIPSLPDVSNTSTQGAMEAVKETMLLADGI